jgi:galactokinase
MVSNGRSPGRCTIVGEHVDYADGVVVCMAVGLHVDVELRPAARDDGDLGPLPRAMLQALRERGLSLPPLRLHIRATLPAGAGLSSSAALCGAIGVAALRLLGQRTTAAELVETMLHAERDIAGVPCGPLDQRAVVRAPHAGALLLDCRDGSDVPLPWLDGHVLAACHTGDSHDVGGAEYRTRRAEADRALRALGASSWRDLGADALDRGQLTPLLRRRARHIVGETGRALECAEALGRGDAVTVGRLMHESHASLRDDYEVSTPALDAVSAAAESVDGCLGARLCGAGFGGTAVALVERHRAPACLAAMQSALDRLGGRGQRRGAWVLEPAPGLAELAADVVR